MVKVIMESLEKSNNELKEAEEGAFNIKATKFNKFPIKLHQALTQH